MHYHNLFLKFFKNLLTFNRVCGILIIVKRENNLPHSLLKVQKKVKKPIDKQKKTCYNKGTESKREGKEMFYDLGYIPYGYEDPENNSNIRNIQNTDRYRFNCAGYALETYSWYCPTDGFHFRTWEEAIKYTKETVIAMLGDFCDLRVIDSLNELRSDEYAIAFRLSRDMDFHYIKRDSRGIWRHKRGGDPTIYTMKKQEVFSAVWCNRYNGPIVLMAKKKRSVSK